MDQALAHHHTDIQGLVSQAQAYYNQKHYDQAADLIALALALLPDNQSLMRHRLMIAEAANDKREAALACERLISYLLAHQHASDFQHHLESYREVKHLLNLQSYRWAALGRRHLAISSLERWLGLDDLLPLTQMTHEDRLARGVAFYRLSFLYHGNHQTQLSLETIEKALAMNPAELKWQLNWLILLRDTHQRSKAIEEARRLLNLHPDYYRLEALLASLLTEELASAKISPNPSKLAEIQAEIDQKFLHALDLLDNDNQLTALDRRANLDEMVTNAVVYYNNIQQFQKGLQLFQHYEADLSPWSQELPPLRAHYYDVLSQTWRNLQFYPEAINTLEKALVFYPNHDGLRFTLSLLLLQNGLSLQGWQLYEARIKVLLAQHAENGDDYQLDVRVPSKRLTSLKDAQGKIILIHLEQGIGDSYQFARYLPPLAAIAKRVIFSTRLESLRFKDLWPNAPANLVIITDFSDADEFDYHCPLMSLPLLWAQEGVLTPPASITLEPIATDRQRWLTWIASMRPHPYRPLIGIANRGRPTHVKDKLRSIPLSIMLEWIGNQPQLDFLWLNHQPNDDDIQDLGQAPLPPNFYRLPIDQYRDMADSIALISSLSCVVSVDTVIVHLAAALPTQVIMLTAAQQDWRWGLKDKETLWYPPHNFILHRQRLNESWQDCLKRLVLAGLG